MHSGTRAAFHVDDHLALEPHQAGMREIERDGDAGRVVGAEPLVRDPGVRPHPQPPLRELLVEIGEAALEPGAFERDLEVLQAQLQQLSVGKRGPGEPTWHGASKPAMRWIIFRGATVAATMPDRLSLA